MASEDDVFPFGRDGCSHFGPDLYATLRVSAMTALFSASVSWSVNQPVSQSINVLVIQ